jgi:hypothetical protein
MGEVPLYKFLNLRTFSKKGRVPVLSIWNFRKNTLRGSVNPAKIVNHTALNNLRDNAHQMHEGFQGFEPNICEY